MADLANELTCVDTDATLVPVAQAALAADMTIPDALPKTFGADVPCPSDASPHAPTTASGKKLFDEEVCIGGGTYVFGNSGTYDPGPGSGIPERIAIIPPFYLDKYEVTVRRWRAALVKGFKPPSSPTANAVALQRDTCAHTPVYLDQWCSYSTAPGVPEDREDYPLTCVSWASARAFCQFEGGDLSSEAQWEYVAQKYGRDAKTSYPWGSADPSCAPVKNLMVVQRSYECDGGWHTAGNCISAYPGPVCGPGAGTGENCGGPPVLNTRQGPQLEDAADEVGGDRAILSGVVNLGGSVQELTLDAFLSPETQCWASAPLVSPICVDASQTQHTLRGASWADSFGYGSTMRRGLKTSSHESNAPEVGFRCARPIEGM